MRRIDAWRVGWRRANRAAPRAFVGGLGLAAGRLARDRVGLGIEVEAGVEAQIRTAQAKSRSH